MATQKNFLRTWERDSAEIVTEIMELAETKEEGVRLLLKPKLFNRMVSSIKHLKTTAYEVNVLQSLLVCKLDEKNQSDILEYLKNIFTDSKKDPIYTLTVQNLISGDYVEIQGEEE